MKGTAGGTCNNMKQNQQFELNLKYSKVVSVPPVFHIFFVYYFNYGVLCVNEWKQ